MKIMLVHYNPAAPGQAGGAESAIRDQRRALELRGHEVVTEFAQPERAYQRERPDLVHFHTIHIQLGIRILDWAQKRHIPHCLSLHDYWPFCTDRMLMRGGSVIGSQDARPCAAVTGRCDGKCASTPAEGWVRDLVNGSPTVTFNPSSAAIFERHGVHIRAVIPHGIDTDFFIPDIAKREAGRVITVSAWPEYPTKGMHVLRAALAQIGAKARLVSKVPREQVRDELQQAAIMVFPSCYEETWGLCLTEAMSAGLACIASSVSGPKAQVRHGETGLLVPPNDAGALAEALRGLLADDGECQRLGRNARAWAKKEASLWRMGRDYERFYEEVLHGGT